ncbi:hypothetical protein AtNW77_Chr1g0065461 [Arabidopsis thaliana]
MTTSSFLLPASPPSAAFLRRRFFRHSWLSSKIHHRLPQGTLLLFSISPVTTSLIFGLFWNLRFM